MPYNIAMQRRLARLFPHENATHWLDFRQGGTLPMAPDPVVIIGLNFLADNDFIPPLHGLALILDTDGGASVEDAVRVGADGVLCSLALPRDALFTLARQCRCWNYPFIADCRNATTETLQAFVSWGAHGAVLNPHQVENNPFRRYITHFFS